MSLHNWWLFVGTVFFLSGTPGPNMLHVMSRSVDLGLKRSMASMAGCLMAIMTVLATSAAGLTTLLLALPDAFEILRYAGAAYLIYLGVKAWRAPVIPPDTNNVAPPRAMSLRGLFQSGFAVGISNPKLILFAAAFLPQFINAAQPQGSQFAILVATFAMIETFWYTVYALGGRSLSRYLTRPVIKKAFNRITGTIFVGFGMFLLKARPMTH